MQAIYNSQTVTLYLALYGTAAQEKATILTGVFPELQTVPNTGQQGAALGISGSPGAVQISNRTAACFNQ